MEVPVALSPPQIFSSLASQYLVNLLRSNPRVLIPNQRNNLEFSSTQSISFRSKYMEVPCPLRCGGHLIYYMGQNLKEIFHSLNRKFIKWRSRESNPAHHDLQSCALPLSWTSHSRKLNYF